MSAAIRHYFVLPQQSASDAHTTVQQLQCQTTPCLKKRTNYGLL